VSQVRRAATHEPEEDNDTVEASPRAFGLLAVAVFATMAGWPLLRGGPPRTWAVAVAAAFLAVALVRPSALRPLSRVWQRLGALLHVIVNPIVMAFLFYLVITPFGLVMQWLGKGPTRRLGPDPHADTYWISREGQPPSSMTNQF
jgi:hypothetical protein